MTITAITGDIGSGKSFKQLQHALYLCNKYKKSLVTNFSVNISAIKRYAAAKRYWWVVWLCDNQQVTIFDLSGDRGLIDILSIPYSVVCLDEAGIFLNTREFAKTPKSLLMDLAQSRKYGCDLVYAAQFDTQVDKQFRMLTQYFIHAEGTTIWSKKFRNQRLVWKRYHTFTAQKYQEWVINPKRRNSLLRTWFSALSTELGPLTKTDSLLFECFSSFSRLDKNSQQPVTKRSAFSESELMLLALRDTRMAARWRASARRTLRTLKVHPLNALSLPPGRLRKIKKYL